MRTSWIVIATAVLGCFIGLALTWYEVARFGDYFEASYVDQDPASTPVKVPPVARAAVIGESVFDFGTLEQNQTGTCTFKIRNQNSSPLIVDLDGVSCGLCIKTDLAHTEVAAADELEFDVHYTTHKEGPEFSEYVEVRTSDPDNTVIRFKITGYVTRSIRFSRRSIALGSISAGLEASADFRIYCFNDDPLKIVSHEFQPELPASYFDLEITPLELDDFKDEAPRAKSAVQAKLTMAPGRPLGPVKQTLFLQAQMGEESTEAEIMVTANIVSDIVLIGGGNFIKLKNLVQFRTISSTVGRSTTLQIRVRGPYSDDIKLSIAKIDPEDVLQATIGKPTVVSNGYLYPLTVSVPKGAPSTNRLGSQQGKVGVINIETTHPSAKMLPVYVSFAVE